MQPADNDKIFAPEKVARAKAVKARYAKELRRYPNVVGVGVGFKVKGGRRLRKLAIRVYVREKVPLSKLEQADRLPRSIGGIPVDVIVGKPSITLFDPYHPSPENAARHAVLLGGISIGIAGQGTGTLGGSAFDNSTLMDVIITNWHVACASSEENCSEGLAVQPGEFDNQGIQRPVGEVLRSVIAPAVDAAILSLDGSAFLERNVLGAGALGHAVTAELGMTVLKAGRTSGLTFGTITDIAEDMTACDSEGNCNDHEDVIRFEGDNGMIQPGDSGSLLLDAGGSVVGLCFAGSEDGNVGSACHIQDVLNALNINLTTGMTQQELIAATHVLDG